MKILRTSIAPLAIASALALSASAAMASGVVITEVDPAGSSASYGADWFELTNTSGTAVDISGWTMADNHAASNTSTPYASGATISLSNLTSDRKTFGGAALSLTSGTTLGAGQTAIFLESSGSAAASASLIANFEATWFGSKVPAGLVIGTFNDSANTYYGLSTSGDMVNIFNGSSALVASVAFNGVSGSSTFDNAAGLNSQVVSLASKVGVDGAFTSVSGGEIGSPGVIANAAPVPEPQPAALLLAGLCSLGLIARRRARR